MLVAVDKETDKVIGQVVALEERPAMRLVNGTGTQQFTVGGELSYVKLYSLTGGYTELIEDELAAIRLVEA